MECPVIDCCSIRYPPPPTGRQPTEGHPGIFYIVDTVDTCESAMNPTFQTASRFRVQPHAKPQVIDTCQAGHEVHVSLDPDCRSIRHPDSGFTASCVSTPSRSPPESEASAPVLRDEWHQNLQLEAQTDRALWASTVEVPARRCDEGTLRARWIGSIRHAEQAAAEVPQPRRTMRRLSEHLAAGNAAGQCTRSRPLDPSLRPRLAARRQQRYALRTVRRKGAFAFAASTRSGTELHGMLA